MVIVIGPLPARRIHPACAVWLSALSAGPAKKTKGRLHRAVPVFSTGSKLKGFGQMPGGGEKHIGVFVEHLGRSQDPHLPAEAEDPAKEDMVDRNRLLLFSISISPL